MFCIVFGLSGKHHVYYLDYLVNIMYIIWFIWLTSCILFGLSG